MQKTASRSDWGVYLLQKHPKERKTERKADERVYRMRTKGSLTGISFSHQDMLM